MKKLYTTLIIFALGTSFFANCMKPTQTQQLKRNMNKLALIDKKIGRLEKRDPYPLLGSEIKKAHLERLKKAQIQRALLLDKVALLGGTPPANPVLPEIIENRPSISVWELSFKKRLGIAPQDIVKGNPEPIKTHLKNAMGKKWETETEMRMQRKINTKRRAQEIKEWRTFIQKKREQLLQRKREQISEKLIEAKQELKNLNSMQKKTAVDLARTKKLEEKITQLKERIKHNMLS